MSNSLRNNL